MTSRRDFLKIVAMAAAAAGIPFTASANAAVLRWHVFREDHHACDVLRLSGTFDGAEYGLEVEIKDREIEIMGRDQAYADSAEILKVHMFMALRQQGATSIRIVDERGFDVQLSEITASYAPPHVWATDVAFPERRPQR